MRLLLGLRDLIHDAIEKTTDLVEETHDSAASKVLRLLSLAPATLGDAARLVVGAERLGASVVYETIRITNRGVRVLEDAGIALAGDALPEAQPGPRPAWADTARGALNALHGDFLRGRGNALAIRMALKLGGRTLPTSREALATALPDATGKVCLFVHGLGCTEREWSRGAGSDHGDPDTNFGTLLARDLGMTPLYLRYNTGLHISENGRALSRLLTDLVAAYPRPIDEILLFGHSMGGLVARSAAHYGERDRAPWIGRLTHVVCIGSPHLGAPLEKGVNFLASILGRVGAAGTQVPAKILNARSAGIKDLRFGYVVDEDWRGKDPDAFLEDNRNDIPFVESATYAFVAASITRDPEHPLGQLLGDVMVRQGSASGRAPEPSRHIPFRVGRVFGGLHHLQLQNHPEVYAAIKGWLA